MTPRSTRCAPVISAVNMCVSETRLWKEQRHHLHLTLFEGWRDVRCVELHVISVPLGIQIFASNKQGSPRDGTSCRSCRSLSFYPWLLAWHAVPFYCRLLLRPSRTSRIKAHPQTRRLPYPLVFPRLSLPAPPEPHSPCHHHVLTIPRELTAKQLFLL